MEEQMMTYKQIYKEFNIPKTRLYNLKSTDRNFPKPIFFKETKKWLCKPKTALFKREEVQKYFEAKNKTLD